MTTQSFAARRSPLVEVVVSAKVPVAEATPTLRTDRSRTLQHTVKFKSPHDGGLSSDELALCWAATSRGNRPYHTTLSIPCHPHNVRDDDASRRLYLFLPPQAAMFLHTRPRDNGRLGFFADFLYGLCRTALTRHACILFGAMVGIFSSWASFFPARSFSSRQGEQMGLMIISGPRPYVKT